jgi:hypothetical protein
VLPFRPCVGRADYHKTQRAEEEAHQASGAVAFEKDQTVEVGGKASEELSNTCRRVLDCDKVEEKL